MPGTLEGRQGCVHNDVVEVERMLAEGVDMNARNTGIWPGLCA